MSTMEGDVQQRVQKLEEGMAVAEATQAGAQATQAAAQAGAQATQAAAQAGMAAAVMAGAAGFVTGMLIALLVALVAKDD